MTVHARPAPVDQDIRDAIATRLDRNACIEAGAGTGKTTVLVQRIVELQRLTAALRGLHRARIETIHAFAGGLLRERPIEAGLDPQFEIVDALGATLDFDVAYDRWLAQMLEAQDPRVTRALNRTMQISHLRELAEAINKQRSVLPSPRSAPRSPTSSVTYECLMTASPSSTRCATPAICRTTTRASSNSRGSTHSPTGSWRCVTTR